MRLLLAVILAGSLGFVAGNRMSHPTTVKASGTPQIQHVIPGVGTSRVGEGGTAVSISCIRGEQGVADCYVLTE